MSVDAEEGTAAADGVASAAVPAEPLAVALEGAGDFERFYSLVAPRVHHALALTLGDEAVAAEATQEAMSRAYERWAELRDVRNPAGWVYRVGLNWARSLLRRRRREGELLGRLRPLVLETTSGGSADAVALEAALRQLDVPARAAVVLRYHLQLSTAEISEALGIPTGTVKSRIHRAVAQLRRHLEARP